MKRLKREGRLGLAQRRIQQAARRIGISAHRQGEQAAGAEGMSIGRVFGAGLVEGGFIVTRPEGGFSAAKLSICRPGGQQDKSEENQAASLHSA